MRRLFLLALPALCSVLAAGGWTPIPPEVWALKEEPARGIVGAEIVEARIEFRNSFIQYNYRVRILSDAGRAAANVLSFSDDVHDIEGRTVYPDGKVVEFNKRSDFQVKEEGAGGLREKITRAVPPGLTGNCVVDLSWQRSSGRFARLPKAWGLSHEFVLAHPYYTRSFSVDFPPNFEGEDTDNFWTYSVSAPASVKVDKQSHGKATTYLIHDIPAMEEIPYTVDAAREVPRLEVFLQRGFMLDYANKSPDAYWKAVATRMYKVAFQDDVKKGAAYRAFLKDLQTNPKPLPADPQQAAAEMLRRYQLRMRNLDRLTFEEEAKRPKGEAEALDAMGYRDQVLDLEGEVQRGGAGGEGTSILLFNLMRDQGIPVKVVLAGDRFGTLFNYQLMDAFQSSQGLLVVDSSKGGSLFLDPALRFAAPGLVDPRSQGTMSLVMDPGADWAVSQVSIPAQPAGFNQTRYVGKLEVKPEGDRFALQMAFGGYPEFSERERLMKLEPKEQQRSVRESLEKNLKGATLSKVEVSPAQDGAAGLRWSAEGSLERESSRRMEVYPFPGLPSPMDIPSHWPEKRAVPVVMDYLETQVAQTTITLPEGYAFGGAPTLNKSNRFGQVVWIAEVKAPGSVVVTLKVQVSGFSGGPETEPELKEFLGWVSEAAGRSLIVEKS